MFVGTAVGVSGLVLEVCKGMYEYYRAWKDCDKDVEELLQQLSFVYDTLSVVLSVLSGHTIQAQHGQRIRTAIFEWRKSALEMKAILKSIQVTHPQRTAMGKLQSGSRRLTYPFKKATVQEIAERIKTWQASLHFIMSLLNLETSLSTAETVESLSTLEQGNDRIETMMQSVEEERKTRAIIDSLADADLHKRSHDMKEAYLQTFRWILGEGRPNYSTFATWLRDGRGIFWINGVAGSGKSTLMKFLIKHEWTKEFLDEWAGDNTLLVTDHFFWVAGTPLQRSNIGMLQGLLHQLLQDDPRSVPLVCADRWQSSSSAATKAWSRDELIQALYDAVSIPGRRVCLFIDALDEYQPEDEHSDLIGELLRLSMRKNVKLVVSSRPWPVFEAAFGHTKAELYLEDLTHEDISDTVRTEILVT